MLVPGTFKLYIICNLLLDYMLPMMSLASSLCVSTISDVVNTQH